MNPLINICYQFLPSHRKQDPLEMIRKCWCLSFGCSICIRTCHCVHDCVCMYIIYMRTHIHTYPHIHSHIHTYMICYQPTDCVICLQYILRKWSWNARALSYGSGYVCRYVWMYVCDVYECLYVCTYACMDMHISVYNCQLMTLSTVLKPHEVHVWSMLAHLNTECRQEIKKVIGN